MKRNVILDWLFGKTGGLISPEVRSPWGILLLVTVVVLIIWSLVK